MPLTPRWIVAVLAAAVLGVGAGACGGGGNRENVEQSNQGRNIPEGTPSTIEVNEGVTPTSTQQQTVTQPPPSQTP